MSHIVAVLDAEKARLDAVLAAVPAPSPFTQAITARSLDIVQRMRQLAGESDADYRVRVNLMCQSPPAGNWATSFWEQAEAAVQAEHGTNIAGGLGRAKTV